MVVVGGGNDILMREINGNKLGDMAIFPFLIFFTLSILSCPDGEAKI
jgi:hypothetical protein